MRDAGAVVATAAGASVSLGGSSVLTVDDRAATSVTFSVTAFSGAAAGSVAGGPVMTVKSFGNSVLSRVMCAVISVIQTAWSVGTTVGPGDRGQSLWLRSYYVSVIAVRVSFFCQTIAGVPFKSNRVKMQL